MFRYCPVHILIALAVFFASATGSIIGLEAPRHPVPKPIVSRPIKPEIAVNHAGHAAVIWESFSKEIYVTIKNDQDWHEPHLIGRGDAPKIAIDELGNATAIWIFNRTIQAAIYHANQGQWSTPFTVIKRDAQLSDLKLAGNANGTNLVVWIEQPTNKPTRVFSVMLPQPGANWSAPKALSDGENSAALPVVAINTDGLMMAAWEEDTGAISVVKYCQYTKDQSWTTPLQLSSSDRHAICPSIAMDDHGNGLILWARYLSENRAMIEAAMLPADGSWMLPMDLGMTNLSSYPKLAMHANGFAAAIWPENDPPCICFSSVQFGGSWSPKIKIPKSLGYFTGLAVNSSGKAIVVWKNFFRSEGCDYNGINSAIIYPGDKGWIRSLQIIKPQVVDPVPYPAHKLDHPQVALDGTGHGYVIWGTARFPYIQIADF